MRTAAGTIAAVLAVILTFYILLAIIQLVPIPTMKVLGNSFIRFVGEVTVFMYLVAAGCFWRV